MKTALKTNPAVRPLELKLVAIGVGGLALLAGLVMLGLGRAAGSVSAVLLTFLLAFFGLGLFLAALIIRACRRRDETEEDDAWW